jgi:hypothetical protein
LDVTGSHSVSLDGAPYAPRTQCHSGYLEEHNLRLDMLDTFK